MMPGEHGAACGQISSKLESDNMEWRNNINHYLPAEDLNLSPRMKQISARLSSTLDVMHACVSWIFELGIRPEMPFYQKKNLALINRVSFISLLLAFPGTFVLLLMGFGHPFSLLISGVITVCLILGFNGARHVEWSKKLFAYAPAVIILGYTLLELSSGSLDHPLNYLLARQGLCFALLIPIMIFGFEDRQKVVGVLGICVLLFLLYDVGSMRLGAFQDSEYHRLESWAFFSVISASVCGAGRLFVIHAKLYHAARAASATIERKVEKHGHQRWNDWIIQPHIYGTADWRCHQSLQSALKIH